MIYEDAERKIAMSYKKKVSWICGLILTAGMLAFLPADVRAEEETADTTEVATIPEHISISGQDVSGMTAEQAQQVVNDYLKKYGDVEFTLVAGEKSVTADGEDIGLTAKNSDVVDKALNYGKKGHLAERYKAGKDLEEGVQKDFSISLTADIGTARAYLESKNAKLSIKAVNNGLMRQNGKFTYVAGTTGVTVLMDKSAVAIADFIAAQWDGSDATIPLVTEVEEPKGTQEELTQVKDVLGSYSTDFSTSAAGRAKNVKNGAEKLNGTVLYPGDTLSVYEAVSPFDEANGYALAGSYENGTTVETYGGGICQVSTTLYNAVMRAELEIVTRAAHSMIVNYVEPSMDAAIAGTAKDFQFKNNKETPVYIEGYTSGGMLYFNIYGKETRDPNRKVIYQSEVTSQTDPVTEYVTDASLPVGTIKTTQKSHTGYTARLWKIVTVNGVEESRKVYNNSKYKASNKIVSVGTGSATPEAAAAISNAVATQDEATIRAAVDQWKNGGVTTPSTGTVTDPSNNQVPAEGAEQGPNSETLQDTGVR